MLSTYGEKIWFWTTFWPILINLEGGINYKLALYLTNLQNVNDSFTTIQKTLKQNIFLLLIFSFQTGPSFKFQND